MLVVGILSVEPPDAYLAYMNMCVLTLAYTDTKRPAGALLWAWDADPEYDECAGQQWLVLHPDKWNKHVQYAWRFDPCELVEGGGKLAPLGQGRRAPREPLVDECVTDDEFYE